MAEDPKQENVMDLLDSLETKPQKSKPKKASTRKREANQEASQKKGDDILGFLDDLNLDKGPKQEKQANNTAGEEPRSTKPSATGPSSEDTPTTTGTVPADSAAEEAPADSTEAASSEEFTTIVDPVASISSWWSRNKGGIWGAASDAATKAQDALQDAVQQARQAEARVREEQAHFSFNSLQSRITSVINTIVPPISRHEQLKIHVFHDMVGYPNIDKLLYEVFDYVMDQVEGGGDLNLVVQKGKERHRAGSDYDVHRSLNHARCTLQDGVKLAKASVEEVHNGSKPKEESSAESGSSTEELKDVNNPNIRISEVFISIQPVLTPDEPSELIAPSTSSLFFVVYLSDYEHQIEISTASQAFPAEWAEWLEGDGKGFEDSAIDPREWVSTWVEDGLNLAFGIIAQKYVTTRMGLTKK